LHNDNDASEVRETMPAIKGARITMCNYRHIQFPRSPLLLLGFIDKSV
jgi:hypothetical protein